MKLILLLLLALQEPAENALVKKLDSQIPWITDGTILVDGEQLGRRPKNFQIDRAALLEEAKKKATEKNRLILWYCPRVPGGHMNRAEVLDGYIRSVFFTDPGIVDLVNAKFVPLRMCCDRETSNATGIKKLAFVEPGFLLMTPEGTIVHTIDRLRTYNADWLRAVLVAVLRKHEKYNAPAGDSTDDLMRGGDDEKALAKATTDQKAVILRRLGRYDEVLKLDNPIEKARAFLALEKFGEARAILEKLEAPEALHLLALVDWWTGRNPEPRWRDLVSKHPDTPWAWRAAKNLVKGADTLLDGPTVHNFEDCFAFAGPGFATSTKLPTDNADLAARRAARFLLRAQREDGSWSDSRYVYCNSPAILPNVVTAMTALAALALAEWRDLDPARIDPALARAEKFLRDDTHVNRGENEECYADAYRLLYFSRSKDVPQLNAIVEKLAASQKRNGFWAHEYPNPFATGAVVHGLTVAKRAGAEVPEEVLKRAGEGLLKNRGEGGRQPYSGGKPSAERNSMARSALCELALFEGGHVKLDDVATALESYWRHLDKLEAVRVCDFHADQELGGFFFWHGVFHSCEAACALEGEPRKEHLAKFRAQVLSIPEFDGSFIDSHELGKSYGTAMALLVLRRCR
jgi:hypothetical protein